MSRTLLVIVFCFYFNIASGEPISKITSVVVYPERALVTRSISRNLPPGAHTIVFESLLPGAIDDSLRAASRGSAQIQINGIEVRRNVLEAPPELEIREMEERMQSLLDSIADLESEEQVLKSQRAFLDSIRVGFSENASKELGNHVNAAGELLAMFNFVGQALQKLAIEERQLQIKKREALKKKEILNLELNALKSKSVRQTKSVEVSFDVLKEGNLELNLSYVIGGARWIPLYDARLSEDGKLDLHYKAVIQQTTGEDWQNVELTLSTAQPAIAGDPPKLHAWKIQLTDPIPVAEAMTVVGSESGQQTGYFARGESDFDRYNLMQVESHQASVLFHLRGKASVPSNGSPQNKTISILKFQTDPEYLAIPKISPSVFMRAEINNNSGLPLLPGRVNVFLGNDFSGNSTLPYVSDSQDFRLYFGVDQGIRVKRQDLHKPDEEGEHKYSYKIEVENFKPSAQRVVVLDQIPVSDDEDLKVKVKDLSPEPKEKNPDGMMKWIVDVAPQKKEIIHFQFEVESPKNKQVAGLR